MGWRTITISAVHRSQQSTPLLIELKSPELCGILQACRRVAIEGFQMPIAAEIWTRRCDGRKHTRFRRKNND
jgi:hypothetical protein